MTKPIYLFLLIVMSACATKAQDSKNAKRNLELQKVLNMNKLQYEVFNRDIRKYDKKIKAVLDNKSLDRHSRGLAMEKLLRERRSYVQQHLNREQRRRVEEYSRTNMPPSPKEKQRREQEERLAKNGAKVAAKTSQSKKF